MPQRRRTSSWILAGAVACTALVSKLIHSQWTAPARLPSIAEDAQRKAKGDLEATIQELQGTIRLYAQAFSAAMSPNTSASPDASIMRAPPGMAALREIRRLAADLGVEIPEDACLREADWIEVKNMHRDMTRAIREGIERVQPRERAWIEARIALDDYVAAGGSSAQVPHGDRHVIATLENDPTSRFGVFDIRFEEAPELHLQRLEARLHRLELVEHFVRTLYGEPPGQEPPTKASPARTQQSK